MSVTHKIISITHATKSDFLRRSASTALKPYANLEQTMPELEQAIQDDFLLFLMQAFKSETTRELRVTPLVRYVCDVYQTLDDGARLVVNQPPRTLKSWTAKCFAAWRMGHDPSERIVFLSNTTDLAKDHVYDVRNMMRAPWYKSVFPRTHIAKDRSNLVRLRTTKGGGFFAGSMKASLGGVGATIILIDDGNRIDDCDRPERLQQANEKFDTEILSRLDHDSGRKRKAIILNVQHRIAANDLSGHLFDEHGFRRLAFPLIATRRRQYLLDDGTL